MYNKDGIYHKLITSSQWLRLRKLKLTNTPLCERCEEEGRVTSACVVHHVTPVETAVGFKEQQRLIFDYNNLRSLCDECHVLTHNELGKNTKEANLQRRKEQQQLINKMFFGE